MGLISPGEENLLDFLELRQVLSTYDVELRPGLGDPQGRWREVSREVDGLPRDVILGTRWKSARGTSGCCVRRDLRSEAACGFSA